MSAAMRSNKTRLVRRGITMTFPLVRDVERLSGTQSTELCSPAVNYLAWRAPHFSLFVPICEKQDNNSQSPLPRVL